MGSFITGIATVGTNVEGQDSFPVPGTPYEKQLRYLMNSAYEEASYDSAQSDEVRGVTQAIDYICGKQWKGNRAAYKSRPIDNRIWRLFWESISLLTDIKPIITTTTANDAYKDQARILTNCTKSWWMNTCADLNLALVVTYGLLTTGYAKLEWNQEARHGMGEFNMLPLGPNDLLLLKPKNTMDSAQMVIYKSAMPLTWFAQKNSVVGKLVRPDPAYSTYEVPRKRPSHLPERLFDNLSEGMKSMIAGPAEHQNSSCPMALYREFWFKDDTYNTSLQNVTMGRKGANWSYVVPPGGALYPRGRLVTMGGDVILYDGPNPWWHGRPPFADLRMNIVPWQYYGLSDIKQLIPLQDIINNILAGVMDMVKKAVNPGFYGPKNAFSDAVWHSLDWAMPGFKAQYSATASQAPQFAPQPNLPSFVMQVVQLAMREMDESSARAVGSEALRKNQMPAGDTIEKINQTRQTTFRLKGRRIESFLQVLGDMNLYNIFQCYDRNRRITMLGPDGATRADFDWNPGTMIPAGVLPEDHVKQFAFEIKQGSLLNIDHDEKLQQLYLLKKLGAVSNRTLWKNLEALDIDPDKEEAALQREAQMGMGQAPKGTRAPKSQVPAAGATQ
jgi:hypothetical protein